MRKLFIGLLFAFFSVQAGAQIKLIPNQGQWPKRVLYKADIPGGIFYVEKDTLTYYFFDAATVHKALHNHEPLEKFKGHVVRIGFPGSAGIKNVTSTGKQSSEYYNYFLGNDETQWASNVHATENVLMQDVWKGIDLEITTRGENLKFNFIVRPKADPNVIKLKYVGGDDLKLENEAFFVNTSLVNIKEEKPFAYQEIAARSKNDEHENTYPEVSAQFILKNNVLGFDIGNYDRNANLIIDPIIVFSTFSGSVGDNFGFTATYNADGNGFSGGTVYGTGFPTTPGAFQTAFQGAYNQQKGAATDAGILKYSPDGKSLLWATYLGGKEDVDQPHSMIVNKKGDLIILGSTLSSDFPIAGNGYDRSYNGNGDIYVAMLSEDGTRLISSTFLGGSQRDGLNEIGNALFYNYGDAYRGEVIVDLDDNVLIASNTESDNFPVTPNAFQPAKGSTGINHDGCVVKLSPDLNRLIWSSFLGGSNEDAAYGINMDRSGNIVVAGGTNSYNLYTSSTAYNQQLNGSVDGFIYKISQDGRNVLAATYIGTRDYDQNFFVQVDDANRIYVTGQTTGQFPVSPNVFSRAGGTQYIAILENDLSAIYLSTVFGSGRNAVDLSPSAFLVDLCGRIYFSGWGGDVNNERNGGHGGSTSGLPITTDGFQKNTDGSDFYLIILAKDLRKIVYASYFGGNKSEEHVDGGTSRFDRNGIVYQSVCGGCGGYSDFPTTLGAWSNTNKGKRPVYTPFGNGGCNNALFKIDLNSSNYAPKFKDTTLIVSSTESVVYDFEITDPDLTDSIYAYGESIIFDSKKIALPLATLDIKPGVGKIKGTFSWQTNCAHYSNDTYFVYVNMRDNGCPTPRTSIGVIKIVVNNPPVPEPPAIFCLNRINENTLQLAWDEFATDGKLMRYKLVKKWPDGKVEVVKEFNTKNETNYIDYNAIDHRNVDYGYFIYPVSACDQTGDSTRTVYSVPDPDSIPRAVYIYTVSVENNKALRVIWNKYKRADFYAYDLYRKIEGAKDYKIYKTFRGQKDTSYLDENVNVQGFSYCYKIIMRNQCGLISRDSFYGCSILLKGNSIPFEHQLSWNPYKYWKGDVDKYEITRRYPLHADSIIGTVKRNQQNFTDDKLDYDWGIYWYRVEGFEGDGGKGAKSLSNEIQLVQAPIVYVPNAFTPNKDGNNDSFNIVPVFVKVYHVKVYNRWGEFVWESYNKKFLWDAIYRNRNPFDNVFIWQIDYTGWDGSKHFKNGNVTTMW